MVLPPGVKLKYTDSDETLPVTRVDGGNLHVEVMEPDDGFYQLPASVVPFLSSQAKRRHGQMRSRRAALR
jgi:hypothetical protein